MIMNLNDYKVKMRYHYFVLFNCVVIIMIMLVGYDRPTLRSLSKYVTPHYTMQWKDIGRHLDIKPEWFEIIGDEGDDEECCIMMWHRWLRTDPTATWDKLFAAIDKLSGT